MQLYMALSFFPHHYLNYLQVRDVEWYRKDFKYIKFLPSKWRLWETET